MAPWPEIYLLRHGQTEWNAQHRVQGGLDSPLTELGRAQAAQQSTILRTRTLDGFTAFASPQGRARASAEIAFVGLFDTITCDPDLREISVGDWEGLHRRDIQFDRPVDESEESALDLYDRAPNGEGFAALQQRCRGFLRRLEGPAVIMTHGITSRMLRLVLLDKSLAEIALLPGGQGVVHHVCDGKATLLR